MYTKQFRVVGLIIGLLMLIVGVGSAAAQDAGDIPQITIETTAEGFTVPEEIPEGIVQITFANHSEVPFAPVVVRLGEGVTFEDVLAGPQGPEAGMQAIFEGLLSLVGYAMVMPEMTADMTFDLAPGTYVLVNTLNEEQIQSFTVVDGEGEGAAPPEADVEVVLLDFAFGMPIEIPAGPQLWHIQNAGDQPHQMVIFPLADDVTAGEFNELLLQLGSDEGEGEEPEMAILWEQSPGEQVWITYDLQPGTYAVVCAYPDTSGSGHVHAELGMRQIIIVTE